ncbi:DUF6807 domain-containing protein [Rhodohalobacter sp. 8-1]|uniref:DUF6807 domain-containing protein n=1 Tax=Rhodohalobacter sp. 8-1 TaxID=3131972 RepID=UPI0030EEB42F
MTDFMIHCFKILCVLLFSGSLPLTANAQQYTITVSAGGFDRIETVVSFTFPDDIEQGVYQLTAPSGKPTPLQVDGNTNGWFILDSLSAGSHRTYTLTTKFMDNQYEYVQYSIDEISIAFQTGNKNVLSYFYRDNSPPESLDNRYKRGGYIHPVYSPGGVELTSHLNVDHHPHHLGIWSAWTNTEFQGRTPDFWNFHNNTGNVRAAGSLGDKWDGPVHAGFKSHHQFIDHSAPDDNPVVALNEEWELRVYPEIKSGDYLMFDLAITQTANTGKPLHLPEYHYGGLGVRGHADWDDPEKVTFLTSTGSGREGNATRVRWSHVGGIVDGQIAGLTMMGHPENFRHPQTIRIHPDIPYYNFAPTQLGEMSIKPGSPYITRYRFVTYDGEPDADELDGLWNDYSYPPGVTVQKNLP